MYARHTAQLCEQRESEREQTSERKKNNSNISSSSNNENETTAATTQKKTFDIRCESRTRIPHSRALFSCIIYRAALPPSISIQVVSRDNTEIVFVCCFSWCRVPGFCVASASVCERAHAPEHGTECGSAVCVCQWQNNTETRTQRYRSERELISLLCTNDFTPYVWL